MASKNTKKKAGKRGLYHDWITEDGLKRIESWARDGLTEKDIAEKKIGVSQRTFDNWKNRFPSIISSLKRGKAPIDVEVENKLLRNALGYEYEEIETYIDELPNGQVKKKIKKVKKYAKPDTTAQIFWLKNRKPELWRDRQSIEHTGKDGGAIETSHTEKIDLSNLTDKELEQLENIIRKSTDTGGDTEGEGKA